MTSKLPVLNNDINEKYQLLAKIGSGGMGDVFLGIQRGAVDFSRLVVIKRIHDREVPVEYAEENARMFLNEASVVASLNHPHIVKIFDFCMAGSSFCIVMEYVEGETLRHIFSECNKKETPIPIGLSCRIIYDACNTLHYAHNSTSNTGVLRRIIHRDIGLHNLMLDSNGFLKVIDFGIAKSSIQTDMTSPGLIKGNPSYMAPELFNKSTQDHRIDIYALGLCLYELLTQTRAFQFGKTATVGEVIQEITNRELPVPSKLVENLPEGLDDVVMKAVEKDRDKRYQVIEEFAEDLKKVAGNDFMSGANAKKWFTDHFDARLKERREFGAKIVELAKKSDSVTQMAIPSKIAGFPSTSGIIHRSTSGITNPSGTRRGPPPPPIRPKGFVARNLHKILGVLGASIALVAGINIYVLFAKDSPTSPSTSPPPQETQNKTDNVVVSCTPVGARLSIDGKELGMIGEEGLSLHVSPNEEHEITLSKKGFRDFTLPFIGPQSGQKKIHATLIEVESADTQKGIAAESDVVEIEMLEGVEIRTIETPKRPRRRFTRPRRNNGPKADSATQKKPPAKTPPTTPAVSGRKIPLPDEKPKRKVIVVD